MHVRAMIRTNTAYIEDEVIMSVTDSILGKRPMIAEDLFEED